MGAVACLFVGPPPNLETIYKVAGAICKLCDAIYRLSKTIYQRNMMLFIKCGVYVDIARVFSHGFGPGFPWWQF